MSKQPECQIHLPDFIIIGSMKSGTTSLYDDLRSIPGAFMPSDKEPNILLNKGGVQAVREAYRNHFMGCPEGAIRGEASTAYTGLTRYPDVSSLAREVCGDELRLVMILRDPVSRIISHLKHDLAVGRISKEELDEVVLREPRYLDTSHYAMQLEPWVNRFGKDKIMCVSFTEYTQKRIEVVSRVAQFVGLEFDPYKTELPHTRSNASVSLRRNRGLANTISQSTFYRQFIRRKVAGKLRRGVNKLLSTPVQVADIALQPETMDELKSRTKSFQFELETLLGQTIPLD